MKENGWFEYINSRINFISSIIAILFFLTGIATIFDLWQFSSSPENTPNLTVPINTQSPTVSLPTMSPSPISTPTQESPNFIIEQVHTFGGFDDCIGSISFSTDNNYLISGGSNGIILWDFLNGLEQRIFSIEGALDVAFGFEDDHVVTTGFSGTFSWDIDTGNIINEFEESFINATYGLSINLEDTLIALGNTNNDQLTLFNNHGQNITTIETNRGWVMSTEFVPNSNTILTGHYSGAIALWDIDSERIVRHFTGHTEAVSDLDISPDGNQFASASFDDNIRFWDIETGRPLFVISGHRYEINSIEYSPDGRIIVSGGKYELGVWDVSSGNELLMLDSGDELYPGTGNASIRDVAFSPDGIFFVTSHCTRWDRGGLTLWRINSG